jgi:hypothetical protein
MNYLKLVLGAAAAGTIMLAFRDFDNGGWLQPALPGGGLGGDGVMLEEDDEEQPEEPVLGYDGMDRDTLLEWLDDADLDEATLLRMRRYESAGEDREAVVDKIDDLLAAFG